MHLEDIVSPIPLLAVMLYQQDGYVTSYLLHLLALHMLSHTRQVAEKCFNIVVVCKADVIGNYDKNLEVESQRCSKLPFLM